MGGEGGQRGEAQKSPEMKKMAPFYILARAINPNRRKGIHYAFLVVCVITCDLAWQFYCMRSCVYARVCVCAWLR